MSGNLHQVIILIIWTGSTARGLFESTDVIMHSVEHTHTHQKTKKLRHNLKQKLIYLQTKKKTRHYKHNLVVKHSNTEINMSVKLLVLGAF